MAETTITDARLHRALEVLEDVIRMAGDGGAAYLPLHAALEGEIAARDHDDRAVSERLERIRNRRRQPAHAAETV